MEKDIVPDLLEMIQKEFHENFNKSEKIKALEAKVRDGTATYIEAQRYAVETGDILAKAFKKYITEDALPDGRMYYNIAQRILQPTLKENYTLITDVAKQVQEVLNKKAGLGLKAVVPEFNQERVDGLVNHLDHAETFEDIARTLDEPIKQHAMSIVSDSIEENARFQYDAGFQPKIVREAEHKCCEWCKTLQGSYRYPDEVPEEIYRRHDRCRCTVDYVVGKNKRDVHNGNRGNKRRYVKDAHGTYVISKDARIKRAKEMAANEVERKKTVREKRIANFSGSSTIKSGKVLSMNLQLFANGKDRAEKFAVNWPRASLQHAIEIYAKGAEGIVNSEKGKITYRSSNGRYTVVYDYNGDYFRIEDNHKAGKRRYVDFEGNDVSNVTIGGKTRGRTKEEYESITHFSNTDFG